MSKRKAVMWCPSMTPGVLLVYDAADSTAFVRESTGGVIGWIGEVSSSVWQSIADATARREGMN